MTEENLKQAVAEAKRFIKKAQLTLIRAKNDSYTFYGCKETGAVKRASMDLTRSLSKLRNNI